MNNHKIKVRRTRELASLRPPLFDHPIKWQHVLIGMVWILSVMSVAWLAWLSISYSANPHAITSERKHIDKAHDQVDQQTKEADIYFLDRAHATEEGFKAAFPFYK